MTRGLLILNQGFYPHLSIPFPISPSSSTTSSLEPQKEKEKKKKGDSQKIEQKLLSNKASFSFEESKNYIWK